MKNIWSYILVGTVAMTSGAVGAATAAQDRIGSLVTEMELRDSVAMEAIVRLAQTEKILEVCIDQATAYSIREDRCIEKLQTCIGYKK